LPLTASNISVPASSIIKSSSSFNNKLSRSSYASSTEDPSTQPTPSSSSSTSLSSQELMTALNEAKRIPPWKSSHLLAQAVSKQNRYVSMKRAACMIIFESDFLTSLCVWIT
jgi:hypothetical protein